MTSPFLWLAGAAATGALALWWFGRHRRPLGDDRGTISEQWLHNHQRETHERN